MLRKFFQGVLFMLLVVVLLAIGYGVWVYRQTGAMPFTLPGMANSPSGPTALPTITPTPTPTPVMQPVVIASRNLPAGTLLSADDLTETRLPSKDLPSDVATHTTQVVGKLLRDALKVGEPVRLSGVVPRGQPIGRGSQFAQMLHPGEVAIAYPITRLDSVAFAPRPGDRVDVVVTFLFVDVDADFQSQLSDRVLLLSRDAETGVYAFVPAGMLGRAVMDTHLFDEPVYVIPAEGQRPRMVAQLTVRGARVLYFGSSPLAPTPPPQATPPPPDMIVLAVSPQDAVVLNFFLARGAASTFALRSAMEEPTPQPQPTVVPVTLDYIRQNFGAVVPEHAPWQMLPSGPTPTPRS